MASQTHFSVLVFDILLTFGLWHLKLIFQYFLLTAPYIGQIKATSQGVDLLLFLSYEKKRAISRSHSLKLVDLHGYGHVSLDGEIFQLRSIHMDYLVYNHKAKLLLTRNNCGLKNPSARDKVIQDPETSIQDRPDYNDWAYYKNLVHLDSW